MSYFNNLTLTTKGQEMLLSSNTNIDKIITFTNANLGSEKLLPEEIKGATEIKNSWLKFPLNSVRIIDDESNYFLRTEIAFTNTGITESKIMQELGIYAKFGNEEEVLFAYSTTDDDGETIPKEDIVPATYKFTINTTISTETKINQILSPDGFLTKEVVELLKYYIANIAVQRFKGALTAGQTVININSEGSLLTTLSKRLQLFIGGELYSEGTDYTVNVGNNTIHLNDEFRFEQGTLFEIIDNLPPGYVKELLDEFFKKVDEKELEVLGNLETVQTENIEAIKVLSKKISDFLNEKNTTIIENLDEKIQEFYLNLDTYIENNKEKLKGKSLYQSWLDIGNIGSESDFVVAMKIKGDDGDPGRGIVSTTIRKGEGRQRIITILYTDDTTNELTIEDGQSAYEVWISDGNSGTTVDFFKSLEGAGLECTWRGTELGIRVKGDAEYTFVDLKGDTGRDGPTGGIGPQGKGLYEYWLELGNEGTEKDFVNEFKPNYTSKFLNEQANGDRNYAWVDSKGNQVGTYTARGGKDGKQGIPGLNWDGTRPEYPDIPVGVPYGTLFELAPGALPTSGWVFANGETLPKGKYPHLVGVPGFESRQVPETSDINIDGLSLNYMSSKTKIIDGIEYWFESVKEDTIQLMKKVRDKDNDTHYTGGRTVGWNYQNIRTRNEFGLMKTLDFGTDVEEKDYMEVHLNQQAYLHRFSFYKETSKTSNDRFYIQVKSGELWTTAAELNPSTDFLPDSDRGVSGEYFYIDLRKYKISTYNFRIVGYNLSTYIQRFCGFRFYAGAQELQYKEIVTLPLSKTEDGRFKIVYVGQPVVEFAEPTMYSYSKEKELNGELPFSLAVENKFPYYVDGITMSEPNILKLGYTNKYNKESDTWELIKTHEDKEGYYYDEVGTLKYIPKPSNWVKWDNVNNNWIEDIILKEKAKKELLNKHIELEIKKDKMIQLEIDTITIIEEIKKIKMDLEELNG